MLELARILSKFGNETPVLGQYAIAKYAEALEVVPRTLAENTGLDDTEILSKLYKAHSDGDKAEKEKEKEKGTEELNASV